MKLHSVSGKTVLPTQRKKPNTMFLFVPVDRHFFPTMFTVVTVVQGSPYRPPLLDAGEAGEKAHTVRLGGPTCLAGDIIGDYSFDAPLAEGDKLIFGDMAIYTTCKNNTFNGMPLPPIWLLGADGNCRELVHFGYQDFKMRLGAQ